MFIPPQFAALAVRFAQIIASMHFERATGTARDRRIVPFLDEMRAYLRRLGAKFAALAARAQAGTVGRAGRRVAGGQAVQRLTWPRPPRALPTGYMWMGKLAPWMSSGGSAIYTMVLTDPEMAALIEAAPQVKRLLRSILWATYLRQCEMPEILRLQPRVRVSCRRAPVPIASTLDQARPTMRRPNYRPSAKWPKGVLTAKPRSRGKLRFGAGPPLPD